MTLFRSLATITIIEMWEDWTGSVPKRFRLREKEQLTEHENYK
jgi:hypothetical protein